MPATAAVSRTSISGSSEGTLARYRLPAAARALRAAPGDSRPARSGGPGRPGQVVTSADVSLAHAMAPKITAYTANDTRPCSAPDQSTGDLNKPSQDSQ